MSKPKIIIVALLLLTLAISGMAQHSISTPAGPVYSYSHISTSDTRTVKQSAGTLHSIVVNSSAVSPCTATLYDSIGSSTTIIGIIDCSNTFPRTYDVAFSTGLTITVNANPAPDLTVLYQ